MNAIHRTGFGHWSDSARLHSDSKEGPTERFLELDDEHKRSGQGNVPMGFVCAAVVFFPLLLVGIGSLAILLIQI